MKQVQDQLALWNTFCTLFIMLGWNAYYSALNFWSIGKWCEQIWPLIFRYFDFKALHQTVTSGFLDHEIQKSSNDRFLTPILYNSFIYISFFFYQGNSFYDQNIFEALEFVQYFWKIQILHNQRWKSCFEQFYYDCGLP